MFRGPFDKVFINFVGHGSYGALIVQDNFLYADDLIDAFNYMYSTRSYSEVIFFNLVLCDM